MLHVGGNSAPPWKSLTYPTSAIFGHTSLEAFCIVSNMLLVSFSLRTQMFVKTSKLEIFHTSKYETVSLSNTYLHLCAII